MHKNKYPEDIIMKKIIALLLAALTLSVTAIGVSAAKPFADVSKGHYFVMNFDDPDNVFAADKYFNWGYTGGLAKADGCVKIPKGTADGTEMSIGHASIIGKDGGHADWITSTLKYAAVTYKTAGAGAIGLKFAPTEAKWNSSGGWSADDYQKVSLPATKEFTTVIVPLDAKVQYSEPLFLFAFTSGGAAEDIYVKNIGFFASEGEAKTYYGITDKAPETSDAAVSAIVLAVSAIAVCVISGKKKNR